MATYEQVAAALLILEGNCMFEFSVGVGTEAAVWDCISDLCLHSGMCWFMQLIWSYCE